MVSPSSSPSSSGAVLSSETPKPRDTTPGDSKSEKPTPTPRDVIAARLAASPKAAKATEVATGLFKSARSRLKETVTGFSDGWSAGQEAEPSAPPKPAPPAPAPADPAPAGPDAEPRRRPRPGPRPTPPPS
ncbi:MAG TPA: hypothetical protein VHS54_08115 [Jatrophihabitans sp.]|nr:hypothetical protein [Jatrophihabitans sp.]